MRIDHDRFVAWTEKRFGDVKVSGFEVQVNDPWWTNEDGLPDQDFKCWINTDKACYRAFKSDHTGHLVEFVMDWEGCDWDEAVEIAGGKDSLYDLEKKLVEFLNIEQAAEEIADRKFVRLPGQSVLITSQPQNPVCRWAKEYIEGRRLSPSGFMVCLSHTEEDRKYKNRIIVPYYGRNGELIYFNTRALSKKDKVRYRGPSKKEFGVGKGDVLWMSDWPISKSKIYLTEGEFDAMSLAKCGFHAAACGGKTLGDTQIEILSPYRICLSFDADKAGKDVYEISQSLLAKGQMLIAGEPRVTMVRPPKQYKDWNKFLVEHDRNIIRMYIEKYEQPCNEDTLAKMRFQEL
jgi:DNA primase